MRWQKSGAFPGVAHLYIGNHQPAVTSWLPLLLLDVDGVLNPFAAAACAPGYTEHEFFPGEKLPAVATYVGDRAVAWIDDALPPEAHSWAAGRDISTLLISVDPVEGLTRRVVDQALEWADTLASLDVMPHTPSSNR